MNALKEDSGTIEKQACDHRITMPIDDFAIKIKSCAKLNMAMLAAYYKLMVEFENSGNMMFCCYFSRCQKHYYELISFYEKKYENATVEQVAESYKKTLEKRLSLKAKISGVQLKAERGIYNDD